MVVLGQRRVVSAAVSIHVKGFVGAEIITFPLAPLPVVLDERFRRYVAQAVAVPESHDKVYPFLVVVRTLRAGERFVHARIHLVGQRNKIILQNHVSFYVQSLFSLPGLTRTRQKLAVLLAQIERCE